MARRRSTRRGKGEGSVFQRTDGTWQGAVTVGYTEEGKQKRKTVYGKTQAEALTKIGEIKQQLLTGTLTDTKLTMQAYLDQWLTHKERHIKPRTAESYRHSLEHHVSPRIGRKRLDKLTPLDVQGMIADVAETSGVRTANICRTVLFSAMKQAIRWQLLTRNPVEAVDPLKGSAREMVLWTPEEVGHFRHTSYSHRRGELLGLRWQDINGNLINVRQTLVPVANKLVLNTPKTAKGQRHVTVSLDVTEVLERHRSRQEAEKARLGQAWPHALEVHRQNGKELEQVIVPNDFVFPSAVGTLMSPRNLERTWYTLQDKARAAWQSAVEQADDMATLKQLEQGTFMPKLRFHDLRHWNVSMRRRLGQDSKLIANQIGHADSAFTTRLYTHLFEEDLQGAAVSLLDFVPKSDSDSQD
jgi:integrase